MSRKMPASENRILGSGPLVSVITGFYNRGHLLERTLSSLQTQSYGNYEVVIFDDCSTDGTQEIYRGLPDWLKRNVNFYTHEKNIGFVKGLIRAIGVARGEYIAIQGSGDESLPGRIALQVEAFRRNPSLGVVGCFHEAVVEESGFARVVAKRADGVELEKLLRANPFSHGEVMLRRSFYNAAQGYNENFKFCSDIELWARMLRISEFHTVPEVLYRRYIQSDGVSYAPNKFMQQVRYHFLAKVFNDGSLSEGEVDALKRSIATEPIEGLVSLREPEIQKKIVRKILGLIIIGRYGDARKLSENIMNPLVRAGFKLVLVQPFRSIIPPILELLRTTLQRR